MFRLQVTGAVSSTNDVVKRALAEGEPEGLAVQALSQTGGYGRQGRTWESPEGGLYLSLLLRPEAPVSPLPTLSLAMGAAVRRAIASLIPQTASDIKVKWPNDIVMQSGSEGAFSKIAGISLEAYGGGVCVGIGVNVVAPSVGMSLEKKYAPAFLADYGCANVDTVRDAVLREVSEAYAAWLSDGLAVFLDELRECDALRDRCVRVLDRDDSVVAEGRAAGLDGEGRLVFWVDVEGGAPELVAVSSGEAHLA